MFVLRADAELSIVNEEERNRGVASSAPDDIELLRIARGGDFEAFSALVERFQRRVFATARRSGPAVSTSG